MYRQYVMVIGMLFFGLCYLQPGLKADDAEVYIEIDTGCDTQVTMGEDLVLQYRLAGAAQTARYTYLVSIYTGSGKTLGKWKGVFTTDDTGDSGLETIETVVSLPLGTQYAEIYVPELNIADVCTYTVGGETLIEKTYAGGGPCYCHELEVYASLDTATAQPQGTVTLFVTANNSMECGFIFDARSLEVDLGELGGIVTPLVYKQEEDSSFLGTDREDNRIVDAGKESDIVEYPFVIPLVPGDQYPINVMYSDPYCTWAASVLLNVEPVATLSVVSPPKKLRIDEKSSATVDITNSLGETMVYTMEVSAPDAVVFNPTTSYDVTVEGYSSAEITVYFTPVEEGEYQIQFRLLYDGSLLDDISSTITVEEPAAGSLTIMTDLPVMDVEESAELQLQIENTSRKDITYQVSASPSEGIHLSESMWDIPVAREERGLLNVTVTATDSGPHYIDFELSSGGEQLVSTRWNVTVEGDNITTLVAVVVVVSAAAGAFALKFRPHRSIKSEYQSVAGEKAEYYEEAGIEAQKGNKFGEAAEYFEKAADIFKEANKIEESVELYKKAADLWRKLKNVAKALENEEKAAKTYEEAGIKAHGSGSLQKAADYLEKAADLWRKTGKIEKSVGLYKKTARMLKNLGNTEKAKEIECKAAETYEEAGHLAHSINELQRSAELFEKAAGLWEKSLNGEKAAEICRKAANLYKQTGNTVKAKEAEEKAAEAYENAGDLAQGHGTPQKAAVYYEKAADLWKKTGNNSKAGKAEKKALESYEQV